MRPEHAARRPLPAGFDNPDSPYFVPRNLRSFYLTVTVPHVPADQLSNHEAVENAVYEWVIRYNGGGTVPA
ncbi:hypothetical protein [uncultured Aeromicrobium sp.]|uniref:hypothetical protein n=1 Tax=uncultured Aeromicrobium sp. TaxID=337820 RepID=UPI000D60CAE9|nr:hypothetical protein [uncultured Aeromicrobium sp.]PWD94864.1 hypothetical protein DEQ16_13755 [Dietzia maris]